MTAIAGFVKNGVGFLITDTALSYGPGGTAKESGAKKVVFSKNCIIGFAGMVSPVVFSIGQKIADNQIVTPSANASEIIEQLKAEISSDAEMLKNNLQFIVLYNGELAYTPSPNFKGFTLPSVESASIGNAGTALQTSVETLLKYNNIDDYNSVAMDDLKKIGKTALESVMKTNNFVDNVCYVYKQVFTTESTFTEEGVVDVTNYQTYEASAVKSTKKIKAIIATNKECSDGWTLSDECLEGIAMTLNAKTMPMVLLDKSETHYKGAVINKIGDWIEAKLLKPSGASLCLLQAVGETTEHSIGYNYSTSIALQVNKAVRKDNKNIILEADVQDIALTQKPIDESCVILQAYAHSDEISIINDCEIIIKNLTNINDMTDNTTVNAAVTPEVTPTPVPEAQPQTFLTKEDLMQCLASFKEEIVQTLKPDVTVQATAEPSVPEQAPAPQPAAPADGVFVSNAEYKALEDAITNIQAENAKLKAENANYQKTIKSFEKK